MNLFCKTVCALALCLFTITAPPAAAQDEPAQAGLTPLAIGNSWTYRDLQTGSITTERIVGTLEIDGHDWYMLRTIEVDAKNNNAVIYEAELWLAHFEDSEADALTAIDAETGMIVLDNLTHTFRFDVEVGDTYRPEAVYNGITIEVTGVNETIQTPAGEFTCTVYTQTFEDDPGYSMTFYLAPGTGVVRTASVIDGNRVISDLIACEIAE